MRFTILYKKQKFLTTAVVRIGGETFEVASLKDGNTRWLNKVEVENDEWDHDLIKILFICL